MHRYHVFPALAAVALAAFPWACVARASQPDVSAYPPGTILTVAGDRQGGFAGDGGPAIQAMLAPLDQVVDASGNLFIADTGNNRIRKVSPDGTITTVAGSGATGAMSGGFSGDGGPATKAQLNGPVAVAVDAAGDLFISDFFNSRVRKVDAAGTITTVADVSYPQQIAVDPMGNLYVVELPYLGTSPLDNWVRKVDPAGTITTVAGGGRVPTNGGWADGRGDGGLATEARFELLMGVALDRDGNLYLSDFVDNRVRKVSADGRISTVAGGGQPPDGVGDGGPATDARLDGPDYLAVDAGGNLFIAENRGERIRKVSPAGIITTVAGSGEIGHTGDGGMATAARLNSPNGVTVDRAGNLFFTEGLRWSPVGAARASSEPDANHLVREVIGVAVPG